MLSRPDFGAGGAVAAKVMSVSELNRGVRAMLERGFPLVTVRGEISGFTRAASGHVYFSLKDGAAQVRCAMWRNRASSLAWPPRDGDAVEVRAAVTLFEARGEYQLNVDAITRAGAGALFEAFVRLKEKLGDEGLFDAARKRALPGLPRAIGVVTSLNAAALRDVLTTLARRAPMVRVVVYPVPVQGEGAAQRIAAAIAMANARAEVDTLIVCRGGGSIEDLWAFNEEVTARAIAASAIPVVSGVGHETDFSIADFVADLRAPTPTGAAELAAPAREALLGHLAHASAGLARAIESKLGEVRQRLDWAARGLVAPADRLALKRRRVDELAQRLSAAGASTMRTASGRLELAAARLRMPDLARARERLAALALRSLRARRIGLDAANRRLMALAAALSHLDPTRVLARGYAVVRDTRGRALRDAGALAVGDALEVTLARGGVEVRVEKPY
jgi:exodeoxyribonuclease VII large subunit